MSDDGTPGTAVSERAVAAVAVVGALVLLAGLGLSARGTATADLPTRLVSADAGTVLVTADGWRPARAGDLVPDGARVRTASGLAALETDGRTTDLAPGSEVLVVDGARQRLVRGSALVDAADGPGVDLLAAGTTVAVRDDAVVRVDRERLLRVVTYRSPDGGQDGGADVTAPGRRRTVPVRALHQLQVAGGLVGQAAPLALRADAWERAQVPQLVEDDRLLRGTVRMLADSPAVVEAALPGAERPAGTDAETLAEQTLSYALAHEGGDFDLETYLQVQDGRSLGGSWGVVAALAGASPAAAERFLDAATAVEGGPGVVLAAGDAADLATEVLGTLPGFAPTDDDGSDAGDDGGGERGPAPRPDGTTAPRPGTTPSPAPSRGPLQELLDTVLETLPPLPAPTPEAPDTPAAPVRSAPPLVEVDLPVVDRAVQDTVDGVVGGLTGR